MKFITNIFLAALRVGLIACNGAGTGGSNSGGNSGGPGGDSGGPTAPLWIITFMGMN